MVERYTIPTRVRAVEQLRRICRVNKVGDEVVSQEEVLGWFVLLEGSHEHLFLGMERPSLEPGQRVNVIIEPRT